MKRTLIINILVFILAAQLSWAEIPQTMGYQGMLTDAGGAPVSDGNYDLTFSLYEADTGGAALWTETQSVAVVNGVFNVILGSVNPLTPDFDNQYWLGVTVVGAGSELTPRIQLTSSPYSLSAQTVADGAVTEDKIAANAVTSGKIDDGAVGTTDIADGAVTGDKIADGQVVRNINDLKDGVILAGGTDVTIEKSGNTLTISATIADGSVTSGKIAENAVTTFHILNGTIAAEDVGFNYADSTLPAGPAIDLVSSGAVDTTDIADNAVTTAKIGPDVVSSIDGVTNDGGDVDVVPQNAITVTPDDSANTITIGESHSTRADDPHSVTATQTGAIVSVDGVSNAGGDVDLVSGTNITITPNDTANSVTISATDSTGDDWSLTGNSGTVQGTHFLGTTDDAPLELRVNGLRALRLEPPATSPNLIGGYSGNSVTSGVFGATISGGGYSGYLNRVTDDFGTVGGGMGNQAGDDAGMTSGAKWATVGGGYNNTASQNYATVGGGDNNTASGTRSTVGGGWDNTASGMFSTVGGGDKNTASKDYATVGGGYSNTASKDYATVGGGYNNTASKDYATVGGGYNNTASGQYSFAAGRRAKANHDGAFVWGDSTNANIASTGNNQFIVRANGGAYVYGTGLTVSNMLTVNGSAYVDGPGLTVSNTGDAALVLEADTDNVNEDHNPGIEFIQDGGVVSGFLGYEEGTNHLLLVNRYDSDISRLKMQASGGIYLYTNPYRTAGMYLEAGGSSWSGVSDRNAKANFVPVDCRDTLKRLASIPMETWNYKTQDPSIRHMGPMAQDFQAAFGLGSDGRHICSLDLDGVSLAAIQGLYEIVREKDAQIAGLEARLTAIEAMVR